MESFKGKPRLRFDGKIGFLLEEQFRDPCFQSGHSGRLKSEHEDTMCRGKDSPSSVLFSSSEAGTVVSEVDFFGVGERMTRIVLGE